MSERMQGKVSLVTGATFGIGKATALGIAREGGTVVVVGRDAERTRATVDELRRESGNAKVESLLADLSSLEAVRGLAKQFGERHARLDVLVNNAGAFYSERKLTADGYERTWALNHLAYFVLTLELLDALKAAGTARVVNVSSALHARSKLDFDNLQGERSFSGMASYAQSKLANVLFTYALARRLAGTGVTVNCVHPGVVATGLANNAGSIARLAAKVGSLFMLTPEEGAATSIYLATSPDVAGVTGQYFVKRKATPSSRSTYDESLQEKLWTTSVHQTGLAGI